MEVADYLTYNQDLQERISNNLLRFDSRKHEAAGHVKAAVAIAVAPVSEQPGIRSLGMTAAASDQAALVLTRRASRLKRHSGQWAFPGGRLDEGESPQQAALRELAEEVGVKAGPENILGRLDDFTTRSGYIITPVVVWIGGEVNVKPNPAEVASVHRIPITEFMRKDAPILDESGREGSPVLFMPVGDTWIAAPTAAIIYQFREVAILGRATRVAHYDQPYFAWR